MKSIISVINLKKDYGTLKAVKGVSFDVYKDEVFGILGPNGAGKTTTLEMMEGLRKIDSGKVMIDGIDAQKCPDKIKNITGVQLQATAVFDYLTLAELLDLYASFYGRKIDSLELLDKVDLEDKKGFFVDSLSGGQKQRFSIAIALVNDPKVIFLDEPSTGLDPQARRNLWDLVKELRLSDKKTVVLTTHYMDEAEYLCDRVAVMDHGDVVALDTPDNLINELLKKGFKKKVEVKPANLEDVFIDLTGHSLRE
ncbi:ABC transporter ATP-binding protein [Candidatus Dojkabacteria bacterium]|nr:ABC transporter ATP-binding protein [Candidatus Dojkabacteria bacterium]